jgi:nitronate monooxygenase
MLQLLLRERVAVVSFHFGLPSQATIDALHESGAMLFATATHLDEARILVRAGIDAIVPQGHEAGGHRGVFDPDRVDECLSTFALTRLLVRHVTPPVISAGGILDGAGIACSLRLGASAAHLGTAFITTDESAASASHRALLGGAHTVMTRAISGRPARAIANRLATLGMGVPPSSIPPYPIAYDAALALDAASRAVGESCFGAHWAGQRASLARTLPAAELLAELERELALARSRQPPCAMLRQTHTTGHPGQARRSPARQDGGRTP